MNVESKKMLMRTTTVVDLKSSFLLDISHFIPIGVQIDSEHYRFIR